MTGQLEPTIEIIGITLSYLPKDAMAEAKADINAFLNKEVGLNTESVTTELAENSAKEINLCLPYYSWVPDNKAQLANEAEMQAAGGQYEVFLDVTFDGHLWRAPPTSNSSIWHGRNHNQFEWNLMLAEVGRLDLADHTYDGDFSTANWQRIDRSK